MVALRLAEVRGVISYQEGRKKRRMLEHAADVAEATHEAMSTTVRQLAQSLKERSHFIVVGGGPNLGSAMFGAAKLLEAAGVYAQPQDLEEWVHLQRFLTEDRTPTFLLAPPGLGYSRAVEVAAVMRRINCFVIAVVEEHDTEVARFADVVLAVKGTLPEALTPLVYSNAVELFASDLAEAINEPYFRGFEGRWATPDGDPIWFSESLATRNELFAMGDPGLVPVSGGGNGAS